MQLLAVEFHRASHQVTVVTETPGEADFPFPVIRRPGFAQYLRLCRDHDVILSAPLSLRRIVPQALSGRRIFVAHPDILLGNGAKEQFAAAIKKVVSRFVTNIVPSDYMATQFHRPVVIMNPYDTESFRYPEAGTRRENILFLGRLTPRKGGELLVEAYGRIASDYPHIDLTIVGDGFRRPNVEALVEKLGLGERVRFAGILKGQELIDALHRHEIMVIPSITEEPFGIVALEGLASGCRMVVARSGGLPEAVGPHALQFRRGDVDDLTRVLRIALEEQERPARADVEQYLTRFRPEAISRQYLDLLEQSAR